MKVGDAPSCAGAAQNDVRSIMSCQNGQLFTRRSLLKSKPSVDPKKRAGDSLSPTQNDPASRHISAARSVTGDRHSIAGPMSHPGRRGAAHTKPVKFTTPLFVSITASETSTISALGLAGGCIRRVGHGSLSRPLFWLAATEPWVTYPQAWRV
jgi:hypothetical protein